MKYQKNATASADYMGGELLLKTIPFSLPARDFRGFLNTILIYSNKQSIL